MRAAPPGVAKASPETFRVAKASSRTFGVGDRAMTPPSSGVATAPSGTFGGPDSGMATVVAVVAVAVVVTVLGVVVQLGAAVASRHRAETAADLAALAGAAEGVRGREAGCARAREVAEVNGARVLACTWRGWSVAVIVARPCDCPVRGPVDPIARARAGPVRGR